MWRFVCAFRKFIRCQTWIEHVLGVGNSEHTRWIGTLILLYVFLLLCSAHFHLHWLSTCKGLESHYSVSSPASAMGHSHKCVLKSLTDRHYWLLGTCRETLLETSFIGERSSARIWAPCKNKLTKLVTGQMIIAWSFVEATAWRERATGQPALPQGDSRHWEPPGLKKKGCWWKDKYGIQKGCGIRPEVFLFHQLAWRYGPSGTPRKPRKHGHEGSTFLRNSEWAYLSLNMKFPLHHYG